MATEDERGPRTFPRVDLPRAAGREAFGEDPAGYDAARPAYPEVVWELLESRCGLAPGRAVLEIGPGTGLATRTLLARGAAPLVAIEPDPRLAAWLRDTLGDRIALHEESFEEAALGDARFDLAVSATAFHWIDARVGLPKVAAHLRPGGSWAAWWTVFGDPERDDLFHDATVPLLEPLATSPSAGVSWRAPFALDAAERIGELEACGAFEDIQHETFPDTWTVDPEGVRALYGTFSSVNVLPSEKRAQLLDALVEVAEREFGGGVERNLITSIYTARRR